MGEDISSGLDLKRTEKKKSYFFLTQILAKMGLFPSSAVFFENIFQAEEVSKIISTFTLNCSSHKHFYLSQIAEVCKTT